METTQNTDSGQRHQPLSTTNSPVTDLMCQLSTDVIVQVLQYLGAEDLSHVALCCRRLRDAANKDSLWRPLCRRSGWERYGTVADISKETPYEPSLQQTGAVSRGYKSVSFQMDAVVVNGNQLGLDATCKWKEIYMKARHLENNWENELYNEISIEFDDHTFNHGDVTGDNDHIVAYIVDDDLGGIVKVWDVKKGTCQRIVQERTLKQGTFCGSSKSLKVKNGVVVVGCEDGVIRTFSASTGEGLRVMEGHGENSVDLIFFDGEVIISGVSFETDIRVWDAVDGACWHILKSSSEETYLADLDYRDKTVAAAYSDDNVRLWDSRSGACLRTLTDAVDGLARCKLGDGIVVCGDACNMQLCIWSKETGERVKSLFVADEFGREPDEEGGDLADFGLVGALVVVWMFEEYSGASHNVYDQRGFLVAKLGSGFMEQFVSHGRKCVIDEGHYGGTACRLYKTSANGLKLMYAMEQEETSTRLYTLWMDDTKIVFREEAFSTLSSSTNEKYIVRHYW